MLMRWPRGRYNGRRITGLKVSASIDLSGCDWKPILSWRLGYHHLIWLWFILRFETVYHFND